MTSSLLPPEVSEPLRAILNRIADEVAAIAALAHSLPAPLAAHLRRRAHGEVLALMEILLAAPPCSLCPPEGGCSSTTCRAG